jgi:hypothetical protein
MMVGPPRLLGAAGAFRLRLGCHALPRMLRHFVFPPAKGPEFCGFSAGNRTSLPK